VPQHIAGAFFVARLLSTFGGIRHVQATLADFLSEGHFALHVRRMTRMYAAAHSSLPLRQACLKIALPSARAAAPDSTPLWSIRVA
jgi:hypothetical protein